MFLSSLLASVALFASFISATSAAVSKPVTISSAVPYLYYDEADNQIGREKNHEAILAEMERLVEDGEVRSESDERVNPHLRTSISLNENPDIYLSTPQLIEKYGYPSEVHYVTTEDGYILQMHRIKHGKNPKLTSNTEKQRVIFLQHGMFGTSADWVLNSVEKSLAYMLADAGYDVWLGNARGNAYSQRHVSLAPSTYKFWRFSWHEMGYYDLPAEIDYVLNTTSSSSIYYVGHSMGTTMFFVLMSTRPEYNNKIKYMTALGPAVYLNSTKSSVKFFANWWGPAEKIFLDTIGHGILLPKLVTKIINTYAPEFCTEELKKDRLCEDIMAILTGYDSAQTNYTQLPVILAHEPSTVSSRTAFHYFQSIHTGDFRLYNKGFRDLPPRYNLTNVKTPVALFWGLNDILCDPVDVARLAKDLPNVVINFRVNYTKFDHIDFVFAKDVDILVNRPLMRFLEKF